MSKLEGSRVKIMPSTWSPHWRPEFAEFVNNVYEVSMEFGDGVVELKGQVGYRFPPDLYSLTDEPLTEDPNRFKPEEPTSLDQARADFKFDWLLVYHCSNCGAHMLAFPEHLDPHATPSLNCGKCGCEWNPSQYRVKTRTTIPEDEYNDVFGIPVSPPATPPPLEIVDGVRHEELYRMACAEDPVRELLKAAYEQAASEASNQGE